MRRSARWAYATLAATAATLPLGSHVTLGAELEPPPVFQSVNGELDLIVKARATSNLALGSFQTTGWVYEVCTRASVTQTACDPASTHAPYGGVELHLAKNDILRMRLVNSLPVVCDADHRADNPDLVNNPTNIHTHGLIVEPRRAADSTDTYGDYVFVEVKNAANSGGDCPPIAAAQPASTMREKRLHLPRTQPTSGGNPMEPGGNHPDMDVAQNAAEYRIDLLNHPSGLFWFHPHMHGLALNQVTAGLSGAITVGSLADRCAGDAECQAEVASANQRLMILKDSEILSDGTLKTQQDPAFCQPTQTVGEPPRQGVCAGDAGAGFGGGHWVHSINGQVYPDIPVGGQGEIWRIVNSAGSRSYSLSLQPDGGADALPLQVLSIDGITIDAALAGDMSRLKTQFGNKLVPFRCPDVPGGRHGDAVCTRNIRMMPSARVELRVLNMQANAIHAVFRTANYDTGGDNWPAIDLASVTLASPVANLATALKLQSEVQPALSPAGVLGRAPRLLAAGQSHPVVVTELQQQAKIPPTGAPSVTMQPDLKQAPQYAIDQQLRLGQRTDPSCANLKQGEHRRIYFGNPHPGSDGFGIATSVITRNGQERLVTPMRSFDPTQTTICLTAALDTARHPTRETWEVINLTDEDHNFHIHQTRFWLVNSGPTQPDRIDDAAVLQDNVPIVHAKDSANCDGSIAKFNTPGCHPNIVKLRIPFTQIGDFVFHCHILEHEDGGMMARIRVVAPPYTVSQR